MLEAARIHGESVFYIGFNKDMSEQYIRDAAEWAKHFSLAASAVEEFLFDDGDEDSGILAYRLRFASGHQVVALSSRPKNLRSKKGHIRIDEAAFHDDLDELLKAAIAILMWGGSVAIWSTHNSKNNPFAKLVDKIREGELDYSLHRCTLQDAVEEGLYRRICLITGTPWTIEGEFEWVKRIYADYGPAAKEELDVEPFAGGDGSVFNRHWFNVIPASAAPTAGITCRHWDIAGTAKELAEKHHYYTAGTKMNRLGDRYTVLHSLWQQIGPSEVENLITATAKADGKRCLIRIELEGGSNALIWAEGVKRRLRALGFNADFVSPRGDKVTRAMPYATDAYNNNVDIVEGVWNDTYLDCLQSFDGSPKPLVNDVTDSSSGCYSVLSNRTQQPAPPQPKQRDLKTSRVF